MPPRRPAPRWHRDQPLARSGRLTRTQRMAHERLLLNLRELENEDELAYMIRDLIPEAWATLEADVDVEEPKTRITLRLDTSVARFSRAMGPGYQARINRVLATFAQMRMAGVRRMEKALEDWDAEQRKKTGE